VGAGFNKRWLAIRISATRIFQTKKEREIIHALFYRRNLLALRIRCRILHFFTAAFYILAEALECIAGAQSNAHREEKHN
jgi:hypothetical protein